MLRRHPERASRLAIASDEVPLQGRHVPQEAFRALHECDSRGIQEDGFAYTLKEGASYGCF